MALLSLMIGIGCATVIAALLYMMVRIVRQRPIRRVWRCVRAQGGGAITTPRAMTAEHAVEWIGTKNNGEVLHVDHLNGFIFYRGKTGV